MKNPNKLMADKDESNLELISRFLIQLGQVILEYLERIEKAEGVQEGIQNLQEYIQAKQSSSLASGSTQQAKNNEKKSKKSEGNSAQNDANSSATRNESQGISSSEIQPRSDENYSSSPQILPIRGKQKFLPSLPFFTTFFLSFLKELVPQRFMSFCSMFQLLLYGKALNL